MKRFEEGGKQNLNFYKNPPHDQEMLVFLLLTLLQLAASRDVSSPEALRTATELLRSIGESATDNVLTIEATRPDDAGIRGQLDQPHDYQATHAHVPHYSLFAPSDGLDNNLGSMDGSNEVRFKAKTSSLALQSAPPQVDAASSSSSSPPTAQDGDVVGSFTVVFASASNVRSIVTHPLAMESLVQRTRRVLLRLINPNGLHNDTNPKTIHAHMVEVDVSYPTFVLQRAKKTDTNATTGRQRRSLTINVALRGLSLVQDNSALAELNGVDFSQRLLELYMASTKLKEEQTIALPRALSNGTVFGIASGEVGVGIACPLLCGGNGLCLGSGVCRCFSGFVGADCAIVSCPQDCGVHGTCNDANRTCTCDKGYKGDVCQHQLDRSGAIVCPNDCSSRGNCNQTTGACDCTERWSGEDCTTPVCPEACGGHGECVTVLDEESGGPMPSCVCEPSWSGDWCASPACPLGENGFQCSGHAVGCVNRTCACHPGWQGEDCGQESCPNDCSHHGDCVDFTCQCNTGWAGVACNYQECAPGCDRHGACQNGTCACMEGFVGLACDRLQCVGDCHGRGACVNTAACMDHHTHCRSPHVCQCFDNFFGASCELQHCPMDPSVPATTRPDDACSHHGQCQSSTGECVCSVGWWGVACEKEQCPSALPLNPGSPLLLTARGNSCSGHGNCDGTDGHCHCDEGKERTRW